MCKKIAVVVEKYRLIWGKEPIYFLPLSVIFDKPKRLILKNHPLG